MRPRSASYGSRPARPAPRPEAQPPPRPGSLQPGYMHDETEDLNVSPYACKPVLAMRGVLDNALTHNSTSAKHWSEIEFVSQLVSRFVRFFALQSPTVGGPRDIVRQISKTLFADAPVS